MGGGGGRDLCNVHLLVGFTVRVNGVNVYIVNVTICITIKG